MMGGFGSIISWLIKSWSGSETAQPDVEIMFVGRANSEILFTGAAADSITFIGQDASEIIWEGRP